MKHFLSTLATGIIIMLFISPSLIAGNTVITSKGIGDVKIGADISKLPESISGVYDKLEMATDVYEDEGAFEEEMPVCRATLGGETVFVFYPEGGKVGTITVYSNKLKTKDGLSLDSTPSDLFAAGATVISLNEGGEAFICKGILFRGFPQTPQGLKKSEEAYLGANVSFDASDFVRKGHATEIIISDYWSHEGLSDYQPAAQDNQKMTKKEIILLIIILIIYFGILGHMLFCNFVAGEFADRRFAGSFKYIGVTVLIAIIGFIIDKDWLLLIFPTSSIVLYWLSCYTLRPVYSNHQSGMSSLLREVFGLYTEAPVYKVHEVTKEVDTGIVVQENEYEDHSMSFIGLAFAFLIMVLLAYLMIFIAISNWIRNYVLINKKKYQ